MLAICHTYYSLQNGVRSPKDWAQAAVQRGYSALALADINGLYGAVNFYRDVKAAGLKPIIGVTLCWQDNICIVLATSEKGYRQLCRLVTIRHLDAAFNLAEAVCRSGGSDLLFLARTPHLLQKLERYVPKSNLFLLPVQDFHRNNLWDTVGGNFPKVNIPDAWFIDSRDRETFRYLNILQQLSGRTPVYTDASPGMLLPSVKDWRARYGDTGIEQDIQERCCFRFCFNEPLLPNLQLPSGETSASYLRQLCLTALEKKYTGARKEAARQRLDKELAAIEKSQFMDFFLYAHEIIDFAESRNIPVEVRGSAASSIVSYLLNFTHCCPLEHDLYFERFINPGRRDYPDIDIDIADNRRDEIIRFCYDNWGEDHVAMIATVLTYRSRSAIRDAGRILRLKPAQVQNFLDGKDIPQKRELLEISSRLIGLPRHLGIHCGGIVITPGPLTDITPLTRATKGVITTHFEKDQAEAIGLIKMDLLGNSALSVISGCTEFLRRRGEELLEPGPAFDFKVNRLFANGNTLGVYQCESPGMRQLCRALRPTNQKEAARALSLIRPGPAAAGMKEAFIRRRRGVEEVKYLHPHMSSFLASTYGVMLYQEDVMKVAVQLAGYTIADADLLRRAVSKARDQELLKKEHNAFVFNKAAETGLDADIADKIWEQVAKFASYSYCKAHASVYGRLAWLTARLKAHYPCEFYAAVLNAHKSMYPKRVFVWEALRRGIPVFPPDINLSGLAWEPTRHGIRAGLGIIKGLRRSLLQQLILERRRQPFKNLRDLRMRINFQAGELEKLILAGTCRHWGSREELLLELWNSGSQPRQLSLFPTTSSFESPPMFETELLLMDIPFSGHPVPIERENNCPARDMANFLNRSITMIGILDAFKITQAKNEENKREMSFATLEDASGMFEVVLFPDQHKRFGHLFSHVGPYRVNGTVHEQWDSVTLEVHEVSEL